MNNTLPHPLTPARGRAKLANKHVDSEKKGLFKVTIFDKSVDLHNVTNVTIKDK